MKQARCINVGFSLFAIVVAGGMPTAAFGGQLLLAEDTSPGIVAAYNSANGALLNSNFLSTTPELSGIGASGSNIFVASENGVVGEYTTAGATVNAALITESGGELGNPVIVGSNLYVANYSTGVVGEYTTSGGTVNASLITGLSGPYGLATDGTYLYIANYNGGTISKYTLSGTVVNAPLVTGLSVPAFLAVVGSNIFVTDYGTGCVGEYTTAGATVNACLISIGASAIWGITTDGTNLFVGNYDSGVVGEYSTSGTAINATLLTGPSAYSIVYAASASPTPTPIPSSWLLILLGMLVTASMAGMRKIFSHS